MLLALVQLLDYLAVELLVLDPLLPGLGGEGVGLLEVHLPKGVVTLVQGVPGHGGAHSACLQLLEEDIDGAKLVLDEPHLDLAGLLEGGQDHLVGLPVLLLLDQCVGVLKVLDGHVQVTRDPLSPLDVAVQQVHVLVDLLVLLQGIFCVLPGLAGEGEGGGGVVLVQVPAGELVVVPGLGYRGARLLRLGDLHLGIFHDEVDVTDQAGLQVHRCDLGDIVGLGILPAGQQVPGC